MGRFGGPRQDTTLRSYCTVFDASSIELLSFLYIKSDIFTVQRQFHNSELQSMVKCSIHIIRQILKLLVVSAAGITSGFLSVLLHRFAINQVLPFGFIAVVVWLFASSVVVRYYFANLLLYIYTVIVALTVYSLAALGTGDILISGGILPGEKPWSGALGLLLIACSATIPLTVIALPSKWLQPKPSKAVSYEVDDADLQFMHRLADTTDKLLTDAFLGCSNSNSLRTELKPDGSPVTQIDRQIEQYITSQIRQKYPNDAILGEEFGKSNATTSATSKQNGRRWIIDPIDGTKNFVRKVPVCATLIALEEVVEIDGQVQVRPVKSIVSAPLLKRRWWGIVGTKSSLPKAWMVFDNFAPQEIRVSQVQNVGDATVAISSRGSWIVDRPDRLEFLDNLTSQAKRTRGFGDFYSYMLLAEGAVDIATEPELELYDIAALIPIVVGAGGTFTDLGGRHWTSSDGIHSSFATNSALNIMLD